MELKNFIEEALVDIVDAVEDAQKQLLHGEIVPNRGEKTGDVDIEFEITVKPEEKEGQKARLVVLTGATSVKPPNAAPPPAGGGAPAGAPPPPASKLKFKIPVRLPQRRGCALSRWIEYLIVKRQKRKTLPQQKTEEKK
ncbi:MAG: hypothetical protein ACTFAK_00805 [Candidatus Electronema sp. VV]